MNEQLIISHFGKIEGVTDKYIAHLDKINHNYYLIKHPLITSKNTKSLVIRHVNGKNIILNEMRSWKPTSLEYARQFLYTQLFCTRLRCSQVIAFGSFNAVAATSTKIFKKKQVIFWGVDYSTNRFRNKLLNKIYHISETIACLKSDKVINVTQRQEKIRMKLHKLRKYNSHVITNGCPAYNPIARGEHRELIYIGSLSPYHGVKKFIKEMYIYRDVKIRLHIIGDGIEFEDIKSIVKKERLNIKLYGKKKSAEITKILQANKAAYIGIAPYQFNQNSHVNFGDSLKLKEYVSLGIPFLAPAQLYMDKEIKSLGYCYSTWDECSKHIMNKQKFAFLKKFEEYSKSNSWNQKFKEIEEVIG